jgi:hypothetical protein
MNARACKRLRKVIWPKGGPKIKDREHHAIMASRTTVRPTCVCDSNRRTYQHAKKIWQLVPRNLRKVSGINVRSVSS